jgi:hypothetical protein
MSFCVHGNAFSDSKKSTVHVSVIGGLVVIVLAIISKVRGFKPGRGRWIFKGDKSSYHDFLRRGSKAFGLMS